MAPIYPPLRSNFGSQRFVTVAHTSYTNAG
jgi:hypothetical protein